MSANKPGDPTTLNRLYGRSQGKPLRKGQADLVENLLPQIASACSGTIGRCISRSASAAANTSPIAPTCCPTTGSSGPNPSLTAWRRRWCTYATGL